MVHSGTGHHHVHKRKRVHFHKQEYPHPNKFKAWMDKSALIVGFIGPIMTIPQLYQIFVYKNASGVSAITWVAYLINAAFWLVYGIAHKEKPLIIMYLIWVVLDIFMIIGAIMY